MGSTVLEFLKTVLFSLGNTVENGIAVVQTRVYEGTCCMMACILLFALTLFGSRFIERCFQTPGIPCFKVFECNKLPCFHQHTDTIHNQILPKKDTLLDVVHVPSKWCRIQKTCWFSCSPGTMNVLFNTFPTNDVFVYCTVVPPTGMRERESAERVSPDVAAQLNSTSWPGLVFVNVWNSVIPIKEISNTKLTLRVAQTIGTI